MVYQVQAGRSAEIIVATQRGRQEEQVLVCTLIYIKAGKVSVINFWLYVVTKYMLQFVARIEK